MGWFKRRKKQQAAETRKPSAAMPEKPRYYAASDYEALRHFIEQEQQRKAGK